MEPFEIWLLRRVAQDVETWEVRADLLTELMGEIEAAKDRPQEESHAEAVRDITEGLGIPLTEAERALAALEPQPTVTREILMRRIADAWLEGHWRAWGLRRKTDIHS